MQNQQNIVLITEKEHCNVIMENAFACIYGWPIFFRLNQERYSGGELSWIDIDNFFLGK